MNHESAEVCAVRQMCMCENNNVGKSARESVYLCTSLVRIVTLRLSIRRRSKTILHYLICVAATGRPELVFFLVFKTSAGTSDVVVFSRLSPCLRRRRIPTTMTTVQRQVLRIVRSCFPFSTVQFVCIQGVLRSLRCRCLLLGRVVRPCFGLCSKPVA